MAKKALLMILDGWGIGDKSASDVIFTTPTPNLDRINAKYPHSQLLTSGLSVGLPEGVMGNSEVGHLNIGAGRVIYQDLVRINKEVADGSIANVKAIVDAFTYAKENKKKVHLFGLLSDAGVHSMDHHAFKLCEIAKTYGISDIFLHCFTDGRDTDPQSGLGFVKKAQDALGKTNGKIASVIGRYYAMDRDKRWDRVKIAYDMLVNGVGETTTDPAKAVQDSYDQGITDEFIKPTLVVENGKPVALVEPGDVVICYNYRTDRLRELTVVLSQKDMPDFGMKTMPLHYVTMTRYDDSFKGIHIVYDKDNLVDTLGEVVSKAGLKQIRIAETEKYAHVTFFFSGGREQEFPGEKRILVQSPKVATYDLEPEMGAPEVCKLVVDEINDKSADFICLNFANGDMVGHTGIHEAIVTAVKTVDTCVGKVVDAAVANDYTVMIIADHGNCDFTINADGSPNTAHTTNPVPCVLVSDEYKTIKDGILADVAPTLIKIMGLEIPSVITGSVLV